MVMTRWSINLERLTVVNADEDSWFSDGDEPYFVLIGFRSRFLTPGSTKVFWSEDLDSGWAAGIGGGQSKDIPLQMGVVQFPGVEIPTLAQVKTLSAKLEVIGALFMAFEDDKTASGVIAARVKGVMDEVSTQLKQLIEEGHIDLANPQADIDAAVKKIREATSASIVEKFDILLSSLGDPDDYLGDLALVYLAVDDPAHELGMRTLVEQPLEIQIARSGLQYNVFGSVSQTFDAGWDSLGGGFLSGPAICSWQTYRLDVFGRGEDNALWHKWANGLDWSDWESLGGGLTSDPAAVSWGPRRIDVVARGEDNALWHRYFDHGWSHWESLGGSLTSGPAIASWEPGRLDVFGRGEDHALWHRWYSGGTWSDWESLGGSLASDPAAVSCKPLRIDVVVRGADGRLWHRSFDNGWQDWESLGGGRLGSGPAIASWAPNRLDVVARGTPGTGNSIFQPDLSQVCMHRWHENGTWSNWEILGGQFNSDFDIVSWGSDRLDIVGRGLDNAYWHTFWANRWPPGPERRPQTPAIAGPP